MKTNAKRNDKSRAQRFPPSLWAGLGVLDYWHCLSKLIRVLQKGRGRRRELTGHWRWEEVQVDVRTVLCVGQHVWAHLTCCGAAHRACEHA